MWYADAKAEGPNVPCRKDNYMRSYVAQTLKRAFGSTRSLQGKASLRIVQDHAERVRSTPLRMSDQAESLAASEAICSLQQAFMLARLATHSYDNVDAGMGLMEYCFIVMLEEGKPIMPITAITDVLFDVAPSKTLLYASFQLSRVCQCPFCL